MQLDMEKIKEMVERNVGLLAEELTEIMAAEGGTFYSTLNSCLIEGIMSKYKEIKMIEELAPEADDDE